MFIIQTDEQLFWNLGNISNVRNFSKAESYLDKVSENDNLLTFYKRVNEDFSNDSIKAMPC